MNNYIKIESKATIENIAPIRMCISSFFSQLDIHIDELMDIKTALSEAVTNAVDHAYKEEKDENVVIVEAIIENNESIKIKVKDFGHGIENIDLAMTPAYTTKSEEEHAGMGFTIMESFMDEVIVDSSINEGTTILLEKKIRNRKS